MLCGLAAVRSVSHEFGGGSCADYDDGHIVRAAIWISASRIRKARSSMRLRRSHPVTSELHLLALQDRHAGTTLLTV